MLSGLFKNINKAHIFSVSSQLLRILNTLVTLVLIPVFLSEVEQGYWFSFISLSALMIIADSGFSTIILQFAAHEFAFLSFDSEGNIIGEESYLYKLSNFFIFSVKWSLLIAVVSYPLISIFGWCVMSKHNSNISWLFPWFLYVFGSILNFINNNVIFFFEGCDSVAKTQKIRTQVSLFSIFSLTISLYYGFKLYSLAITSFGVSIFCSYLIYLNFKNAIKNLIQVNSQKYYNWKKEFFSLLGKYSLSWISGYFIFQMYTPVMFHYYGPVEAGKVGITMTLWAGVFTLSNIWMNVVTPKINIYISRKKWVELDKLFFHSLTLSSLTFIIGMIIVYLLFWIGKDFKIISRFLSPFSMIFLALGWWLNVFVNSLATYLRSHKEEPLVIPSILTAVYIVIITYLSALFLPKEYFFMGFFSSYIFVLPWIIYIFNKKRLLCHLS